MQTSPLAPLLPTRPLLWTQAVEYAPIAINYRFLIGGTRVPLSLLAICAISGRSVQQLLDAVPSAGNPLRLLFHAHPERVVGVSGSLVRSDLRSTLSASTPVC